MKLEDKLFKSFFFPFLIAVILSTLVVTLFIGLFNNNFYDKRTYKNIISTEKKYSKINIYSASTMLMAAFEKIHLSLNEHIKYYQRMANKILELNNTNELNFSEYLKCAQGLDFFYCVDNKTDTYDQAIWTLDNETTEYDLDSKPEVKKQLLAYDKMIPIINASLEATSPDAYFYYFYFEKSELYISYPISTGCETVFFYILNYYNYEFDTKQCMDKNGQYHNSYKFKCEIFYENFQKSKTKIFDNNYSSKRNKTIFISNYYAAYTEFEDRKFDMCIQFFDPITKGIGYACSQTLCWDLVDSLESINANIPGFFFISNVGFNNVFYYPQSTISPKTSTLNIFNWEIDYILEEKKEYITNISKIFTSNYIDYTNNSSFIEEIYINGQNDSDQYFYMNDEKIKYSIYPIIFENLNKEKEHILSIIYIYDEKSFLEKIKNNSFLIIIEIIISLLLFIIFGSFLLYIIYLTFNIIAKNIVIPIQNVNYMLKGINIGGIFRLEYLNFLNQKQDENHEKLEDIILNGNMNKKDYNYLSGEKDNNNLNKSYIDKDSLLKLDNIKNSNNNEIEIYSYSDFFKKYDKDTNNIKKEFNFYDFDDELLQYRPFEIDILLKSLADLKIAINLTSSERELYQIVEYSQSEEIFRNNKEKEGVEICQSNIGNLESQLLKFDKAIYHLALSLQDNKLKKFLSKNLFDELDEGDTLLNQLFHYFNQKEKEKKIF